MSNHLQNQNSGGHLMQAGGTMAYGGRVRPSANRYGQSTQMARGGRTPMRGRTRPMMSRDGRTPMRGRTRPTMGRGGRAPMQRGRNPMSMMEDGRRARPAMRRGIRR
jgi:hypothetical protein